MRLHSSKAQIFVDENGTRARLAGRLMLLPVAALAAVLLLVAFSLIGAVSLPGLGGPHAHPKIASGGPSQRSLPPVAGAADRTPVGGLPSTGPSGLPPTGTGGRNAPTDPQPSPPVGASASSVAPVAQFLGTSAVVSVIPAQTRRRPTPASSSAAGVTGTPASPAPAHPAPAHPVPTHPVPTHPVPAHPAPTHPTPPHPVPAQPHPTHAVPIHPSGASTGAHPSPSHATPTRAGPAW